VVLRSCDASQSSCIHAHSFLAIEAICSYGTALKSLEKVLKVAGKEQVLLLQVESAPGCGRVAEDTSLKTTSLRACRPPLLPLAPFLSRHPPMLLGHTLEEA
jgi:hypothetical protein